MCHWNVANSCIQNYENTFVTFSLNSIHFFSFHFISIYVCYFFSSVVELKFYSVFSKNFTSIFRLMYFEDILFIRYIYNNMWIFQINLISVSFQNIIILFLSFTALWKFITYQKKRNSNKFCMKKIVHELVESDKISDTEWATEHAHVII